jgi:glycosyltransferase involved in cell wall biosynthesis
MTEIKRIALIGPLPPPAGGMANLTLKLTELITQQGITVDLIQQNSPYRPSFIEKFKGIRAIVRLVPYFFSLFQKTKHADVVHIMANSGWSWHFFALPAIVISKMHGKPVVVNYHGGDAQRFFNNAWPWVAKSLQKVQYIIVPSCFLQKVFNGYGQQTTIIPNVLDSTIFRQSSREFEQGRLHFIVTRNLEKIYGVDVAIDAFRNIVNKYPTAKLSIAGTGTELNLLKQQVSDLMLSDNIIFTGCLPPNDMASLYNSADIMINASTIDNAPSSILEALACGIPVISTNVGGIPDMVKHEYDALLVEKNNVSAISEQAFRLINDHTLRHQLVSNGLKTIQRYQWPTVWRQLLFCYQQAQQKVGK